MQTNQSEVKTPQGKHDISDNPIPFTTIPNSIDFGSITQGSETIIKTCEQRSNGIADQGTTDGVKQIPATSMEQCHAQPAITAIYENAKTELERHLLEPKSTLENKIAAIQEEQNQPEPLEHYENKLEGKKWEKLTAAAQKIIPASWDIDLLVLIKKHRTIDGVITSLKQRHLRLKEERENAETLYQNILAHQYKRVPPRKRGIDRPVIFLSLIILFALIEIIVNLTSFQTIGLGDTNLGALVLALVFAGGQAWAAKEVGFGFRKKDKKQIKASMAITVFFCLCMGIIRLNMEGALMLKLVYATINFLIAIGTALLAYRHARHHEFFAIQQQRHDLSAKIEVNQYQVAEIEKKYKHACKVIDWDIKREAKTLQKKEEKRLKKELQHLEADQRKLQSHETQCLNRLTPIRQNALKRYQNMNNNARQDRGFAPIIWAESPPKANGKSNGLKHSLSVILLALLCCLGCSYPAQPEQHLAILVDHTGVTEAKDIEVLNDYVLSQIEWDTLNKIWGEVEISLSPIGERSIQQVQSVKLTASERSWFGRNEYALKHRARTFKKELKQALSPLTISTEEMDHSYIWRNMQEHLQHLSKQKGRRFILSFSDLIVNGPEINLYHYEEHPERIWQERDTLLAMMTAGYPTPEVEGIEWVNIHQPDKQNDALHEACKKLLLHHLQSNGMLIEFKANMPGQITMPPNMPLTAQ